MRAARRFGPEACFGYALLLSSGCASHASTDSNISLQRSAIINGLPDTGDRAVVMLYDGDETICSGTLVSPHVVLTAAHCVVRSADDTRWTAYFGSNANAAEDSDWVEVSELYGHPTFVLEEPGAGLDVGVMVLSEASPVQPVAVNREPLSDSMLGKPVRIVGFGMSAMQGGTMGVKLQGTGTFDDFNDYEIHFGEAEQHECTGDSGGPALLMMDGVEKIIGVASRHVDDECMDGYYGRLDTGIDWVVDLIEQADPTFCDDDGNCGAAGDGDEDTDESSDAGSGEPTEGDASTGDDADSSSDEDQNHDEDPSHDEDEDSSDSASGEPEDPSDNDHNDSREESDDGATGSEQDSGCSVSAAHARGNDALLGWLSAFGLMLGRRGRGHSRPERRGGLRG